VTLREYLFGRRIVLRSALPHAEVVERIDAGAGSFFFPVHRGISGGVYFGVVYLRWSNSIFGNNLRPIFAGRLVERQGLTEMRARFGGPVIGLVFLAVYYLLLGFLLSLIAMGLLGQPGRLIDGFAMLTLAAGTVGPLAFLGIAIRGSDQHWLALLAMLEREAGLAPIKGIA
jgi:hypothetical protein